jgi:molybdenum transport protein
VTTVDEAFEVLAVGADVVQLEKLPPPKVAEVARKLAEKRLKGGATGRRPILAAAGGVNLENAAAYAEAGADVLVTSAPYSAKARDIQVTIEPA